MANLRMVNRVPTNRTVRILQTKKFRDCALYLFNEQTFNIKIHSGMNYYENEWVKKWDARMHCCFPWIWLADFHFVLTNYLNVVIAGASAKYRSNYVKLFLYFTELLWNNNLFSDWHGFRKSWWSIHRARRIKFCIVIWNFVYSVSV